MRPSATPPAVVERQRRQAVSDAALVVPDMVRLQLDTALFGDRSPHGSAGPDGAPRSKNLTVLAGTVQVRTNRRGQAQRAITDLGAVRRHISSACGACHQRRPQSSLRASSAM